MQYPVIDRGKLYCCRRNTVLSTAETQAASSDSSGSTAGVVIGILLLLALLAAAMVLLARRNNYRCGTSGPSRVDAPNSSFTLDPVGNRNAVFNDTYTAVNPPPRPVPPRPSSPPSTTHGGAVTNDAYMPAVPQRSTAGTTYVEPVGHSSVDNVYSSADLPDSHYATAGDVASVGAAGWRAAGDHGALANDVYSPAVPQRPVRSVPASQNADLYQTANVPDIHDADAAAEVVGSSFGTGSASMAVGDQGALVNETYIVPSDAPPPRAPPVPKKRPAAAPTPSPRAGNAALSI